jgi:pyruvate dehydrogenase E2 component (dihydrolipoamide acetyltransferase)
VVPGRRRCCRARGDELVEIETDKATVRWQAGLSGVLEIVAPEGATVPVGALIARLAGTRAARPERSPDAEVNASPVARRVAQRLGVELAAVTGSGPGGRIVQADVHRAHAATAAEQREPAFAPEPPAAEEREPAFAPEPPAAERSLAPEATTTRELSRSQRTVACRMTESNATVPDFALSAEVDMTAAIQLRVQLEALAGADRGAIPSVNDLVLKASAAALRAFPRANSSYRDGAIEYHDHVNVGFAVDAAETLLVPTIVDADRKSLREITGETRRLAERARAGEITPEELSGATFTVSNLGMFGVSAFTAIVNPQAAILAVGAIRAEAVVRDGAIVPGHRLTLTLSCDHRILYGADAARFLGLTSSGLQTPLALVL